MTLNFVGRLAAAGCLLLLSSGCDDSSVGAGGTGGGAGTGGAGGTQAPGGQIPGLWEGKGNGFDVCFFVSADGKRLTATDSECNLRAEGQPDEPSYAFDLSVDLAGTDENGERCSFELSFANEVAIDPVTHAFRASEIQSSGEVAFSGEINGKQASGVARQDSGGSFCRVGWAATVSTECDDAAIQSCLDLLDCCRAILINPIFFQSCNSVVLQCDQAQCLQVLAGYPQCAPEPEIDAGTPDGG
jgi:hypothetical protein